MLKNQQLSDLHSYFHIKPVRHDHMLELVEEIQSKTAILAKKTRMSQQELLEIAQKIKKISFFFFLVFHLFFLINHTITTINANSFIDILNSQTISTQTIEIIVFAIIKLIKQPFCISMLQ